MHRSALDDVRSGRLTCDERTSNAHSGQRPTAVLRSAPRLYRVKRKTCVAHAIDSPVNHEGCFTLDLPPRRGGTRAGACTCRGTGMHPVTFMKPYLVALDNSPRAPAVLAAAIQLARSRASKLIVFRAVGLPGDLPIEAYAMPPEGVIDLLRAGRNASSEKRRSRFRPGSIRPYASTSAWRGRRSVKLGKRRRRDDHPRLPRLFGNRSPSWHHSRARREPRRPLGVGRTPA